MTYLLLGGRLGVTKHLAIVSYYKEHGHSIAVNNIPFNNRGAQFGLIILWAYCSHAPSLCSGIEIGTCYYDDRKIE